MSNRVDRKLFVVACAALVMSAWAPNAHAQLGFMDTDPPEGNEPCTQYQPHTSQRGVPRSQGTKRTDQAGLAPPASLLEAEMRCLDHLDRELAEMDDSTEWLSAASIVGALGAVASGLTAQSTGTMNAWLGVGVSPIIADDIRQRPQIEQVFIGVRHNLLQLRCRAIFLESFHTRLTRDQVELRRDLNVLRAHLIRIVDADRSILDALPAQAPRYKLRRILEEGFRIVREAERLARRVDYLPEIETIRTLEQAAYNHIVGEFGEELRSRNVTPVRAFRGVIAAPFRATAAFLSGEDGSELPSFDPTDSATDVTLTAAFRLRLQALANAPAVQWLPTETVPSAFELSAAQRREDAHRLEEMTAGLMRIGVMTEERLTVFSTLASEGGDFCPSIANVPEPSTPTK